MRKAFLIIVLFVFECACSTQTPVPQQDGPTLLEFSDLASEISVNYEAELVTPTRSDPFIGNPVDSS